MTALNAVLIAVVVAAIAVIVGGRILRRLRRAGSKAPGLPVSVIATAIQDRETPITQTNERLRSPATVATPQRERPFLER